MRMAVRLLWPVLGLLLNACGQEKKDQDTVYDYYVEDSEFGSSEVAPPTNSADATVKNDTQFHFISPVADLQSTGTVKVTLAFDGVGDEATWSLFYAPVPTATNGTAIEKDLPLTQTSVDWDTTLLAAGTYYLYATWTANGDSGRSNAAGKITIAATVDDDDGGQAVNKKPTLALNFPTGENVFVAGVPQTIKFNATDADDDALKFKLEYSADGGTTWTKIADDVTDQSYDWDVQGLTQGINYRVKVTADDGNGGTAETQSPKSFGVATTPMTFAAGFGAMIGAKCGACHAVGRANQNTFRSDNFALKTIGVSDKKTNIKARVEAGTMPPAGALGAADKAILTMWIWGGSQ